ncbi:MAG: hypothetical protein Q7K45_02395 [Nanoarchaeota archaeon]|nr:hypothetical protein [Nanoarchaeota archaeon]
MDYNKWGIVMGIISLIFLLISPLLFVLGYLLNTAAILSIIPLTTLFLMLPSILLGITTLVLGILSLKIGNKKNTALALGILYILLLIIFIFLSGLIPPTKFQ